ncbi:PriCT-2 domain-containing protein, partial [bacterium]|nr:PriCT-2 domain-containing protein [bacterium]
MKMDNFDLFLNSYKCQKGCGKRFTHTRIPSQDNDPIIYPGCWAIPKNKMDEFYKLYYTKVFVNKKKEHLTERQGQKGGPILIDLDFRYGTHLEERQHDENHITDIIDLYLSEIECLLKIPNNVKIKIFVLEREKVTICPNIIKDGIHIIIGISMDHTLQQILRRHIMSDTEGTDGKIDYILDDLELSNSYDEVLDFGISKGHTNWQLYGSQKPGREKYNLTRYIICEWDQEEVNWNWEAQNICDLDTLEILKIISAQNQTHPKLEINEKYKEKYNNFKNSSIKKNKKSKKMKNSEINDVEMLEKACKDYLDNLPDDCYHIKETHQFIMALPKKFYDYEPKWIKVGWAAYNTDKRMFPTWMLFSSQSEKFDFSDIPKYYGQWKKMKHRGDSVVTNRSIMYWLKETNRSEYEKIKHKTVEHYMDNVIETTTEVDIAELLYQLYKDKYACVSVEKRIWYEFSKHRWQQEDSGNSLRQKISRVLTMKFKELASRYVSIVGKAQKDPNSEETVNVLSQKIKKCSNICIILKKTAHKNNIMREAAEIFYDKYFLENMDKNPYLLSCENGIIDFKAETIDTIFRKGRPEDYLSLNTHTNYKPLKNHSPKIRKEIEDFMKQLFPIKELNKYMLDHLASTTLGTV